MRPTGRLSECVTLLLCVAFSAQWKEAVKTKSRPTKRLLRVKTSATMDHCQLSLETANSPPARTAPGPGPANLTMREDRQSTRLFRKELQKVKELLLFLDSNETLIFAISRL